jgi:hypothetical protein
VHETTDQKSIGIWANPKPSKNTDFLNISALNRRDHTTRTYSETPDYSGNEHYQKARHNSNSQPSCLHIERSA